MRDWRPDADANIPALSRLRSAPRGQLMMLWLEPAITPALPSRQGTLHVCPALATKPRDALSNPQFLLFIAASVYSKPHRLSKPVLAPTPEAPHIFPATKTPSLAAEQNPLKTRPHPTV